MEHLPYTYLLIHKSTGKWYYGVRYAKNCKPSDLMRTYFTSSNEIKTIIKQQGIEVFFYEGVKNLKPQRKP